MRLFFAIEVDDVVRRRADEVRQALQRHRESALGRGLRWVPPEQVHLTIRFLGEVPDALAAQVVTACREGLDVEPFVTEFGSPTWLPHGGSPRVLVLPVLAGVGALRTLKHLVEARLPEGVPPDDPRPYTPHLTLARVRPEAKREVRAVARSVEDLVTGSVCADATGVTLFRSDLSPRGAAHHRLAHMALRGAGR